MLTCRQHDKNFLLICRHEKKILTTALANALAASDCESNFDYNLKRKIYFGIIAHIVLFTPYFRLNTE